MVPRTSLKLQLHALVAGNKSQSTVKPMGIGTGFIGRQLRRSATLPSGQIKGISYQGIANAAVAVRRTNTHRFNLGAPGTFVAEAGDKSQLQAGNDSAGIFTHDQSLTRITCNRGKSIAIGLGQGISQLFPGCAQWIVSQKPDNSRKIRNNRGAKLGILGHENIKEPLKT